MDPITVDPDSVNKKLANKCRVIRTSNPLAQIAAASAGKFLQIRKNSKLIGCFSFSGICSIGTEFGLVVTCATSTRFQFNRLQHFWLSCPERWTVVMGGVFVNIGRFDRQPVKWTRYWLGWTQKWSDACHHSLHDRLDPHNSCHQSK